MLIGFALFAVIIWWLLGQIAALTVRIDELEDKLSEWQDVDVHQAFGFNKLKFKNIKHVRY